MPDKNRQENDKQNFVKTGLKPTNDEIEVFEKGGEVFLACG